MDIIRKYCYENFLHVEKNIFEIVREYEEDEMELIQVYRNDIKCNLKFHILMNKELVRIFKKLQDYVYSIEIVDNFELKMSLMEEGKYFRDGHKHYVNRFISSYSLILIQEKNEDFNKYLQINCDSDKFVELLQYAFINSSGWIKPRFDCIPILLNNF